MGRNLVRSWNGDCGNHERQEVGYVSLYKLSIKLEEEHHNKGALCDDLERPGARVELRRPNERPDRPRPTAIVPTRYDARVSGIRTARGIRVNRVRVRVGIVKEMVDGGGEVAVDVADKVEEGLDLRFNGGAEVAEEVENDANGDEGIILIVVGEYMKGELEKVLNKRAEHLTVGEAVEDLHHDISELVLCALCPLWRRQLPQDRGERPEVAFQKVQVLRRVRNLQVVPHLHHHLQPHLRRCIRPSPKHQN